MRARYNRKTSPKVIGGLVQRKNNHTKTACLGYVVDRVRPSKGFKHVLTKKDIHDFVDIIPDWNEISMGIESIILDRGDEGFDGLYEHFHREGTGIIWLSAWCKELWVELNEDYYQEHRQYFEAFGVVCEKKLASEKKQAGHEDCICEERCVCEESGVCENKRTCGEKEGSWLCYFTESQAKAFMLMHIFLHELGHHVDRLRSKNQSSVNGGEDFAEKYAEARFKELWPAYVQKFGLIR